MEALLPARQPGCEGLYLSLIQSTEIGTMIIPLLEVTKQKHQR